MMRRSAHRTRRTEGLCAAAAVLAAVAASGCLAGPLSEGNAANPQLESKVFNISCEDGRRYAAKALKARNYRITGVERSGSDTTIDGRNDAERVSSSLTVTCGANGVTVSPSGGGRWVTDGLRFGFYQIADMGDRIWPPPTGPIVKMVLYQGPEAKIEFPTELEPLGVAAVRVSVLNAGERTLTVDPGRLRALGETGQPVAPIAQADAERKLSATDPDIKSKLLKPTKLAHGQAVTGFVFFPIGTYTGGSLALIDDKTGEADDYDVSFEANA